VGPLPYFREVYTGPGLIEELTSPPLNLTRVFSSAEALTSTSSSTGPAFALPWPNTLRLPAVLVPGNWLGNKFDALEL
jgi:hypothetical protein